MSDAAATAPDTTRFFAILMPWGRVGSNLVVATLASSPEITIDNEPTTRLKTYGIRDGLTRQEIGDQQLQHLLTFHETYRGTGGVAILKLSHRSLIDPPTYAEHLVRFGFCPIIMLRDNFVKCAVSQLRANAREQAPPEEKAQWQSPWAVAMSEPKPGPVHIDPRIAIQLAREFEQHHQALLKTVAAFCGDVMHMEYRELASDPEASVRKFYDWFGLTPPDKIRLAYKKATSDALHEDITNYSEFADAVKKAGLGHFLVEDH